MSQDEQAPKQPKNKLPIHPSVTQSRVLDAAKRYGCTLDNPGICLACGQDADGCEPDARRYECECCGEKRVHGAEELLLMDIGHPG